MKCTKCMKQEVPNENKISRYGLCNDCFEAHFCNECHEELLEKEYSGIDVNASWKVCPKCNKEFDRKVKEVN